MVIYHAHVGIVSAENDTLLTITPTQNVTIGTDSVEASESVLVTLHRAETLLIAFISDLTGTKVTSNRPITHVGTNVQMYQVLCHSVIKCEQLPPMKVWGRQFATAPLKTRMSFDVFLFVASENSTTVNISCTLRSGNQWYTDEFALHEGNFADVQVNSTDFCWMEADQEHLTSPICCGNSDFVQSDPFMALVPAVSHYTNSLALPIVNDLSLYEGLHVVLCSYAVQSTFFFTD